MPPERIEQIRGVLARRNSIPDLVAACEELLEGVERQQMLATPRDNDHLIAKLTAERDEAERVADLRLEDVARCAELAVKLDFRTHDLRVAIEALRQVKASTSYTERANAIADAALEKVGRMP